MCVKIKFFMLCLCVCMGVCVGARAGVHMAVVGGWVGGSSNNFIYSSLKDH